MGRGRKDRILREAAEWVVLIDGPTFDADAADRFRRWLARSADHQHAFQLASRTWTDLDQLSTLRAYPDILEVLKAGPPAWRANSGAAQERPFDRRALLVGMGAGAGLAALSAAGYVALGAGAAAEAFETQVGETREIALADGTRVVLNAASRVEARIGSGQRKARLVAGEALFSIAESSDGEAFLITTPSGEVSAERGLVLVKLLPEGAARVALLSDDARAARRGFIGIGTSSAVAAGAGSEIVFGAGGLAIAPTNAETLERRTLWRQGMLAFDDTPLAEAAADISRQSGVRFAFTDPALAELRVAGLVRADDLGAFLDLLEHNLAIRAERHDGEVVLRAANASPSTSSNSRG